MNATDETFFAAYERFLDEHEKCPNGPDHTRWHVWLPRDRPECSVMLTCICGARVVLPASRKAGYAVLASMRKSGMPVTESNAAGGVH